MASRNLSSGQFPTMGESAISVSYTRPQPGKLVPRNIGGEKAEQKTAMVRPQKQETHGHTGGIKVYRDFQNAPEASQTGRRVHPMGPARSGLADFDCRRVYGQGG